MKQFVCHLETMHSFNGARRVRNTNGDQKAQQTIWDFSHVVIILLPFQVPRFHLDNPSKCHKNMYLSRSTPNTWPTPNTCSKTGQISLPHTIPLLLSPHGHLTGLSYSYWLTPQYLEGKWPIQTQSSNLASGTEIAVSILCISSRCAYLMMKIQLVNSKK